MAKDHRGKITGHRGHGILAHSKEGINWGLDKKPYAYSKTIKDSKGKEITLGQLERCSVLLNEKHEIMHLFFATMDGPGGFNNSTESWNICVPLKEK